MKHPHSHAPPRGPAELRASGRRLTRQRRLIWAELTAEPDRHLSAREIVERVRSELPRVNPSTVYRTLELLVDEGIVLRTDLGRDRIYYELAHDHRHHHVVCRECGAVAHVHDDVLGDLATHVDRATGFAIGRDELTLHGLCPACRTVAGYRAAKAKRGGRMPDHEHTHERPHTHMHSHGGVTHSHVHTSHDHEHVEHEHEHRHGDLVHSHPHVHQTGHEEAHEHEH